MKKLILLPLLVICAGLITADAQTKGRKRNGALTFESDVRKLGEVEYGKVYTYTYTFTNTGTDPVVIYNCESSCGCFVSDFSKRPVRPGESGFITVKFAPKDNPGFFSKSIVIESNSKNGYDYVYLQGFIKVNSATAK